MVQKFILLTGLPGSGKSTLAKQLKAENNFFVVYSDMFRLHCYITNNRISSFNSREHP